MINFIVINKILISLVMNLIWIAIRISKINNINTQLKFRINQYDKLDKYYTLLENKNNNFYANYNALEKTQKNTSTTVKNIST